MKAKTYIPKEKDLKKKWILIDARGEILGRLATKIARILIGKGKVHYVPHFEVGDGVVVINARHVAVTGKKKETKTYEHYTGYTAGHKVYNFQQLLERKPEEIIFQAVKGMLPKNRLGDRMLRRLRVYPDGEHRQQAQKPIELKL